MTWRIGHKIAASFVFPFALVIAAGLIERESVQELARLRSTIRTRELLEDLAAGCRDLEAALLRDAFASDSRRTRSWSSAVARLQVNLSYMDSLAEDDSSPELAEIRKRLAGHLAFDRASAGSRPDQLLIEAGRARQTADAIRTIAKQPLSTRSGLGALLEGRTPDEAVPRLWLGTGLAALVLLIAGVSLTMSLTRGTSILLQATEKIRDGVLDYRVSARRHDELGRVAEGFNQMAEALSRTHGDLEKSTQVLRSILDGMADGVVVANPDGRLMLSNHAAKGMLGGGPVREDLRDWAEAYGLCSSTGKPLGREDMPLLMALRGSAVMDRDLLIRNTRAPQGKHLIVSATPLKDDAGQLWAGVLVLTDITERKRAEQALEQSEQKFRAFIETTNEWIWSIDGERRLTYSNPAVENVLGYLPGQVVSESIEEFVQPDDRDHFLHWLKEISEDRRGSVGLTLRWVDKQGSVRWLESNIVPIVDGAKVAGYRGTARDMTLRQFAEAEIQQLNQQLRSRVDQLNSVNKELEAFSYSVSHDLRAPLRSIDGFSQALLEDYEEKIDGDGKDYLRRVRAASQRMAQLIDDLLNLSRVARSEISRSRVDLTAIANSVAAALKETEPQRAAEFVIEAGMTATGDARLLRIVLENLMGNAWKFTRRQPQTRIELGTAEEAGKTVHYVRDNGVGFDMTYAGKLFGAFQRLHAMNEFEGTGIGLATVQRIITRHGGRIWANAAVNEGATFYFTLD